MKRRIEHSLATLPGGRFSRVVLVAKLAVAALVLAFVVRMVDWDAAGELGWTLLMPVAGGVLLGLVLLVALALRWTLLVRIDAERPFPVMSAYRGYLLGTFFNVLLPGGVGGDVVRAHFAATRAGIGFVRSGAIVFAERLFGLLSVFAYAGAGVMLSERLGMFTTLPLVQVAFMLLALAAAVAVIGAVLGRYIRIPWQFYPLLAALSVVAQVMDFVVVYTAAQLLGVHIGLADLLVIVPLVFIASIVPISPGGHGVREGVLAGLLTLSGVAPTQAALIALMLLLTKVGFGLCGLWVFLSERRRSAA